MTEKLDATGTVRNIFFSLGTTPTKDPKFDCKGAIIDLLNNAKESVHIAIYSITEADIINAIIDCFNRGVKISIVTDATESKNRTQARAINKMVSAGVDIRLAIRQKALMHDKIAIVDGHIVATGSFNWTSNAALRNDENLLVIEGKDVAADYEKYVFERILQNETLIRPDVITRK